MTIQRFGESLEKPLIQWYEFTSGERVTCAEKEIDTLWWYWVVKEGVNRYFDNGWVIFEFSEPVPNSLIN